MVTDAKDFELLGDPLKMTGYSRPPESKLTAVTRVLGVCTAVGGFHKEFNEPAVTRARDFDGEENVNSPSSIDDTSYFGNWIKPSALSVTTMMFVLGLSVGWSSPYLAQFASGKSPFPATTVEISWMASLNQLGRIPGAILGAVCVQYFGSKTTLFSNGCCLLISWILVILANSVSWIYVARFICGASIEVSNISLPLYFGDIALSGIRGALVALSTNGVVIGILIGNTMGAYLSMRIFACVALVPNLFFLLTFFWTPNSPYYLTGKGKVKEAEGAIRMYNPKADVQDELESIQKFLTITKSTTFMDRLREFNMPQNRRSGIIICVLCMFTACSGVNPLASYMESIMIRGQVNVIAPSTVPIIANSLGLIAGWTLIYLAERFGRRTMWAVSNAGVCGTMIALGTHFYLIANGWDSTRLQWIAILSMLSFKVFYNLGLSCVASILFSELFASNIRTLAAWIGAVFSAIFGFVSIYGYQFLLEHVNEAHVYWIHAILMFLSTIFGLAFVPEMQGKTLLEIQEVLRKN